MQITAVRTLTSVLQAPQVSAVKSGSNCILSWVPPTPTGQSVIAGYRVFRGTTPSNIQLLAVINDPAQTSITDPLTGTQLYQVQAFDQFQKGALSTVISQTAGARFPFAPGVHWQTGNGLGSNGVSDDTTHMDSILLLTSTPSGMDTCWKWGQLESQAGGVYDGSWDSTGNQGFAGIFQLLNYCSRNNLKFSMQLNTSGNGQVNGSNAWPSTYAPVYLNNSAYGPVSGNNHGGLYYTATGLTDANGNSISTGPIVRVWNAAVWDRLAQMMGAYQTEFGLNWCYRFDPCMELSIGLATSHPDAGYSDSALITAVSSGIPSLRSALPNSWITLRPTFLNQGSYPGFFSAVMPSAVTIAPYDGANEAGPANKGQRVIWGMAAYAGTFPSPPPNGAPVAQAGWTNYQALGYSAHWHLTGDTLGNTQGTAVPPARVGSGLLAMTSASSIMQTMVKYGCTDLFISSTRDPVTPNCNAVATNSGAPANPVPPDGPGPTSLLLPQLMDQTVNGCGSYASLLSTTYPTAAVFNP